MFLTISPEDEVIVALGSEIKNQEAELLRERCAADELRGRINESETGARQTLQALNGKFDSLVEMFKDVSSERRQNSMLATQLSER